MDSTIVNSESIANSDPEINEEKKELSNKNNNEIDKIFGPAIQRNRSNSDLEIVAPLKHKRRHYWSQERLFADKPLHVTQVGELSAHGLNNFHIDELRSIDNCNISPIHILHENQRADIVASVTERLYSKLKKNEKTIPKIESVSEKKTIQPLNELKICSNARQRLMELSQRALRNKRRIGIPAYTQTKNQVIRVKNQAIEIQSDLQSHICQNGSYCGRKDASIATESITPRFKEKAVGSKYGALYNKDISTQTDRMFSKNTFTMTDVIKNYDHSTQTITLPQYKENNTPSNLCTNEISSLTSINNANLWPTININISPLCSREPYSSEDFSDDDSSQVETDSLVEITLNFDNLKITRENINNSIAEDENDFPDDQYLILPHVAVDPERNVDLKDYEAIILGRNKNIYPYNLNLSPCRQISESKKIIKFQNSAEEPLDSSTSDNESGVKYKNGANNENSYKENNFSLYSAMTSLKYTDSGDFNGKDINITSSLENDNKNLDETRVLGTIKTKLEKKTNRSAYSKDSLKDNKCVHECFEEQNTLKDFKMENGMYYFENDNVYHSFNSFFYNRRTRPTPTKYLQYLIQKRREVVAQDFSFKYQRNVSF